MKQRIVGMALGLAIWATAAGAFPTAIHQQGRLLDGTNLYNGAATIALRLFAVGEGGAAVAGATSVVTVVDGLYAAELDLEPAAWAVVLTNAVLYLETDVDGTPLAPRERLGAVPYARLAAGVTNGAIGELQLANGAATADKIGPGAVTEDKLDAGAVTMDKIGPGAVTGDKLGGDSVNSDKIVDGSVAVADVAANAFWQTDGNTAVGGGKFIGTTDGTSFEIRCVNEAVFRAESSSPVAGTTIRMGRSNTMDFAPGGVLAGGYRNAIEGNNYNVTLSGGTLNTVEYEAQNAVLAGGYGNRIGTNAFEAVLSGGARNEIGAFAEGAVVAGGEENSATATNAAIGGGASNDVAGARSVVSGGFRNRALAADAAIGGGTGNVATNTASRSVIGGGQNNFVSGAGATIAGGDNNRATAINATVGGGNGNVATEIIATVAGGIANRAATEASTVGGGANNYAGGGSGWATVGGGSGNQATGSYATVAGGDGNTAQTGGFVGGGADNRIEAGTTYSAIAGGENNLLRAGASHNVIGGGVGNDVSGSYNVIAGGVSNVLFSPYGFIGGGFKNFAQGQFGTVAGGGSNYVDATYGAIGGGWKNFAAGAAAVAGGVSNRAAGSFSMIPGGFSNSTRGAYSLAAGFRASADHDGAFVWADSTDEEFISAMNDQFSVRAVNGARFVGSTNLGSLTISPLHSGGNQDAQIYLTETEGGSYGTILRHDGGANEFQIFGKNGIVTNGPHLVVARDASRVGVGRTPAAYALEVEGDASKTVAGSWLANSDARIKTDVRPIEGALETLARLRPVAFRYTAEHRAQHPSIEDRDYHNFIAQEYREVFPDAVKEDGTGLLSVDTYDVQPYLVRAAQELAAAVAELRQENAELKRRLDALDAAQP
ncbi:MAG: tail fiber domain-containing protein [Kiritimatiellia bacterium]